MGKTFFYEKKLNSKEIKWNNVREQPKVRFGQTFTFVRKFCPYCLSESSAEVRPNRKFGLSLFCIHSIRKKYFKNKLSST